MHGLTFQRERVHEFLDEAKPLYEAHYKEVVLYDDMPLAMDEPLYRQLEESGFLRCYVARDGGELVGYCAFHLSPNLHYRGRLIAIQDGIYVTRSKRGALIGKRLVAYCEDQLRNDGVQIVLQQSAVSPEIKALIAEMKDRKDVGKLFDLLGYDLIDFVHAKRLDK